MNGPIVSIVLVHGGFVDGSGWRGVHDFLARGAHRRGMLSLSAPSRLSLLVSAIVAGVGSVIGFVSLTNGLNTGHTAVVVVLSSLASAVTVLMACSVRSTRLELHQWLALASITAGLVLVKVVPQT